MPTDQDRHLGPAAADGRQPEARLRRGATEPWRPARLAGIVVLTVLVAVGLAVVVLGIDAVIAPAQRLP